jgi:hypothetical protein
MPSDVPGFYIPRLKPEFAKTVLFIPRTYQENIENIDAATTRRYENYRHTKPAHSWQAIKGLSREVVRGRIYFG